MSSKTVAVLFLATAVIAVATAVTFWFKHGDLWGTITWAGLAVLWFALGAANLKRQKSTSAESADK